MIKNYLLIFLGGGLGSLLRYAFYRGLDAGTWFPIGTFTANIISSFFLGWIIANHRIESISQSYYLLLAVGFCGAFSTFSTLSVESYQLILKGAYLHALCYLTTSFLLGILAVYLGLLCVENG